MDKSYFKPWLGKKYSTTKLLIIGESAYSWKNEKGKVTDPSPSHPRDQLLHWIKNFGEQNYFAAMGRALCGSAAPTPKELRSAWDECAYTSFVQGSVGIGARKRPSAKMFRDAGPHFLSLVEKIRPS